MPTIYSQPQAWQAVRVKLGPDAVNSPHELHAAIEALESRRSFWQADAEQEARAQIASLRAQIAELESQIARASADAALRSNFILAGYAHRLAELQSETRLLLRLWYGFLTIPALRRRIATEEWRRAHATDSLDQKLSCLRWESADERLPQRISQLTAVRQSRLTRLTNTVRSPEFAGALGELESAAALANLPDDYTVFHDVHLSLDRPIRFDNAYLQTAQCDHIVVGPAGVYVIESKNWSAAFAASPGHLDPFTQVARARFLCKCILNDHDIPVAPRALIANHGARLTKPPDTYTRICLPAALPRVIQSAPVSLSPQSIPPIIAILQTYLPL